MIAEDTFYAYAYSNYQGHIKGKKI